VDTGLDGQDGGARGCARFQCLVGVCTILERKALIDVNAHLPKPPLEQLVRGSFERIASLYVVEEEWARQKQRTLLRQQNGRNGSMGPEACPNVTINPRVLDNRASAGMYPCRQNRKPPAVSRRRRYGKFRYEILSRDRVAAAVGMGYFGLSLRGNGADDRCAEGGRPLTENEARSGGRGMHEDQVTRLDTLQHHRGCLIERDCIR